MLLRDKFTVFTISELFKNNQQGKGVHLQPLPKTRVKIVEKHVKHLLLTNLIFH